MKYGFGVPLFELESLFTEVRGGFRGRMESAIWNIVLELILFFGVRFQTSF